MATTIEIARDRHAPARAREALSALTPPIDPRLAGDAELLVSELVTNSVKYGAGSVRMQVDAQPGRVRVEVVDDGDGFTPLPRDRPATAAGGWGLQLVDSLAYRWGVSAGSTHVWFELRRTG